MDEKQLIGVRSQIKASLTRFNTYLVSKYKPEKRSELEIRLLAAEPLLKEFNDIQNKIEDISQKGEDIEERETFEQQYFSLIARVKDLLKEAEISQVPTNLNSPFGTNTFSISSAKLPTLNLPKFKGDYGDWTHFYEAFDTLVHSNPYLDNIQKFYHLLGCLEGDAKRVLDCLEITRDNYIIALELLKKRFFNKSAIIQAHLTALVDMPAIKAESVASLRGLGETIDKHTRALQTLKEPVQHWDRVIIFLMVRKLDSDTRKDWETQSIVKYESEPKLKDFVDFIKEKCNVLEAVNPIHKANLNKSGKTHSYVATEGQAKTLECNVCNGTHYSYQCDVLANLGVKDRVEKVKACRLCINCLRPGHFSRECTAGGCKRCHLNHNTILHLNRPQQSKTSSSSSGVVANAVAMYSAGENKSLNQIILSTAVLLVRDKDNNYVKCRALLDSGSQVSFATKALIKKLGVMPNRINFSVSGIGQTVTNTKQQCNLRIKSCHNNFNANMNCVVLDKITSHLPTYTFEASLLPIPSHIKLADPEYNVSGEIDLLIGAAPFYSLLSAGQHKLGTALPILQKTILGWIVAGELNQDKIAKSKNGICNLSIEAKIHSQLERFWLTENYGEHKEILSIEEMECETHFKETTKREPSGRFCVQIPLKNNVANLGDSFETAKKRFLAIERKIENDSNLKKKYHAFMQEYLDLGHMTKIKNPCAQGTVFYLPHHGVLNESSLTTKLRVVFDGSAKTTTGLSLNDTQKIGPKVQDDLFDILLRFRNHDVVITADIAKMYRQVNVAPEQRDLQRILWRFNPNNPIETFQLNTVTYGTASASFLATRCIKQVALEAKPVSEEISRVIQRDFYVDDFISGATSVDHAIRIGKLTSEILNTYGFPLRKWSSNKSEVLKSLSEDSMQKEDYVIAEAEHKTLGIFWNTKSDTLKYVVNIPEVPQYSATKRSILSFVSQIFDPLGLIGPVTVKSKIILQKLWSLNLSWDEALPLDLFTSWKSIYRSLSHLNFIKIPRQGIITECKYVELHGFCDASESAYGACIILRTLNKNRDVHCKLLCAKSRVAPLKTISLPRLELCGAVLLSRLVSQVISALDLKINNVYLWTDSTIVLAWLAGQPSNWKTFVANRVSEIHELTKNFTWRHVNSKNNPADIISRGLAPDQLANCDLWWNGPAWLVKPEQWPEQSAPYFKDIPEKRETKMVCHTIIDSTIFERFSCLNKLKRVTAWCFRFAYNAKVSSDKRVSGELSINEQENALRKLLKIMQSQVFGDEISDLKKNQVISSRSQLKSLDPFLDDNGLIRVGGRLRHSKGNYDAKFPILLPKSHALTKLIILSYHHRDLHAGCQAILCAIRQTYWPINGRVAVRSVISKCITCFRVNPIKATQKMGDLPADRIIPNRPFSICGVDLAGPYNLKDGSLRSRKIVKGYICIFVCFITKAVHIEHIGDLSSLSFLNCLKRFVSRRGICSRIYSDNATNFQGANSELQELYEVITKQSPEIANFCNKNRIEWKFIPARSPHQGGLWEAAVKSAKKHLKRVIGLVTLNLESFITVLTQVEAVLNSRPLTPLSNDPNDLTPLTPGHFLIGDMMTALPQGNVIDVPSNRLKHYYHMQQMVQHFWARWSKEYLHTLQSRNKWIKGSHNPISIGSLVVLIEDNLPPLQWRLGRVSALHPGKDGLIRIVSVSGSSCVKRAIQKVCVLPIDT